jgi:hypothetical protein
MKMNRGRISCLTFVLWCVLFSSPAPAGDAGIPRLLPLFPEGYGIRYEKGQTAGSGGVSYRVDTIHPAAEVLQFYDAWFYGHGWIPAHEE